MKKIKTLMKNNKFKEHNHNLFKEKIKNKINLKCTVKMIQKSNSKEIIY